MNMMIRIIVMMIAFMFAMEAARAIIYVRGASAVSLCIAGIFLFASVFAAFKLTEGIG